MNTNLHKALDIYKNLLEQGVLEIESSAMEYNYQEVKDLLVEVADSMDTYIFETDGMLYIVPEINNSFIHFSNQELLKNMFIGKNYDLPHLYLGYYIAITILSELYSAEGSRKAKYYVLVSDLMEIITKRLKELCDDENVEKIEDEYQFNLKAIYDRWNELVKYKDDKNDKNQKSQYGFILKVVRFFMEQDLFDLRENDTEITATDRMERIMSNYYSNPGKEVEILTLVRGDISE